MWQPGGGLVETPKYKPKELLKNELGDKFEDFLYDTNIELLKMRDEAREYVNNHIHQETFTGYMDSYELRKLLQILDKVGGLSDD